MSNQGTARGAHLFLFFYVGPVAFRTSNLYGARTQPTHIGDTPFIHTTHIIHRSIWSYRCARDTRWSGSREGRSSSKRSRKPSLIFPLLLSSCFVFLFLGEMKSKWHEPGGPLASSAYSVCLFTSRLLGKSCSASSHSNAPSHTHTHTYTLPPPPLTLFSCLQSVWIW